MHIMTSVSEYTYQKHGVSWWIDDTMTLIKGIPCLWGFKRHPNTKPGDGKKVLSHICEILDKKQQPICLQAAHTKLIGYYKQFGFVVVEGNLMLRLPKHRRPRKH
jgi:hypothetical protein